MHRLMGTRPTWGKDLSESKGVCLCVGERECVCVSERACVSKSVRVGESGCR